MAKKVRENGTYLIEGAPGDNPKLMGQELSDGRDSLYLEFYMGYETATSAAGRVYKKTRRSTERLGLFLWRAPRSAGERQQNRDTLMLAKKLRFERGQAMLENAEGYRLKKDRKVDLLAWMWAYYRDYDKLDKRQVKRACTCLEDFLTDPTGESVPAPHCPREERAAANAEREKRVAGLTLKPEMMTRQLVRRFADYVQKRYTGEGPHTLFARFKKMMKAAVEADVLRKDPCAGITIKIDAGSLKKDVLSLEEVRQLMDTHYAGENADIRRAFIFCLYTGLRWCDVRELTYDNVDASGRRLQFEQMKTRGHSSASAVTIPLNDGLLALIGKGRRGERVFVLPSYTMCLKALRHWVARAGLDKHITWHCARHSFAVNILNQGANIKTVASLLGHAGLQHTAKYTRAVDSLKEAAINSLPGLDVPE